MMKFSSLRFVLAVLALWLGLSTLAVAGPFHPHRGARIVVANRASGTISIIDTRTDQVVNTIPLPTGTSTPEPMYVVHSPLTRRVFVGDRGNDW